MARILSDFPNLPDLGELPALPPLPELAETTDASAAAGLRATRELIEAERARLENQRAQLLIDRRRIYGGIYADLERAGEPVPKTPAEEITRDELLAHLQERAGARVLKEAFEDPERRYKPGATDEEIHAALHAPWSKPMPPKPGTIEDQANRQAAANAAAEGKAAPQPLMVDTQQVARVHQILIGLPYAPNELTPEDVAAARR